MHTGRTDRDMCLDLTFSTLANSSCIGGGLSEGGLLSEERAFGKGLVSNGAGRPFALR